VRARAAVLPLVLAVVLVLVGCSDHRAADARDRPTPAPTLGGSTPRPHPAPRQPMDRLEKPVADRLARQIAPLGLTLAYLDCPHWDRAVPTRMTCRGYVDGLVAQVRVLLEAAVQGRAVDFDAWLAGGVLATANLEETLHDRGWAVVDCGDVAAYPAVVGSRIVCRVQRGRKRAYVVATVRSRSGQVMIADYPGTSTAR
jgi:hypothetical protein